MAGVVSRFREVDEVATKRHKRLKTFRSFFVIDNKGEIIMSEIKLSGQPPHSSASPRKRFHGVLPIRGLEDVPRSALYEGRFGRMFRQLPPFAPDDADLLSLGALMIETEAQADDANL